MGSNRHSALQSRLFPGPWHLGGGMQMNPSAGLNLDTGIFEISNWQMTFIADKDLGIFLRRHSAQVSFGKLCRVKDPGVRR
jgi:hypothetical protein